MYVEWIATEPDTGAVSQVERLSTVTEFVSHMESLRSLGEGYCDVHWAARPYPLVTLLFRGPYGVVLHAASESDMYLLRGTGVVADDVTVTFPGFDGETYFSGGFIMTGDSAWNTVKTFLRTGSVAELGEWFEL